MLKKIWIPIMICCCFSFVMWRVDALKRNEIRLIEEPDELSILFVSNQENKGLIMKKNNRNYFILLESISFDGISSILKQFGIKKIDAVFLPKEVSFPFLYQQKSLLAELQTIDGIQLEYHGSILLLTYQESTLCVNPNDKMVATICDFIYFDLDIPTRRVPAHISHIFLEGTNAKSFYERNYMTWLDSTILKKELYTILKIREKEYKIDRIPVKFD